MTDRAVPLLPARDLSRAAKFWRYFDFAPTLQQEGRLRLRQSNVEIEYREAEPMEIDGVVHGALCLILVDDVQVWHDRFTQTRMRWKGFGGPSLTSIGGGGWDTPAFCVTDYDQNLIWVVADR